MPIPDDPRLQISMHPRDRARAKMDAALAWLYIFNYCTQLHVQRLLQIQGRDLLPRLEAMGLVKSFPLPRRRQKAFLLSKRGAATAAQILGRKNTYRMRSDRLAAGMVDHELAVQDCVLDYLRPQLEEHPREDLLDMLACLRGSRELWSVDGRMAADAMFRWVDDDGHPAAHAFELERNGKSEERLVARFEALAAMFVRYAGRLTVSYQMVTSDVVISRYRTTWERVCATTELIWPDHLWQERPARPEISRESLIACCDFKPYSPWS